MKRLLPIAMIALSACAPAYEAVLLQDGAEKVKVFRKTDPPKECREIQPFTARTGSGCGAFGSIGSYEATYNAFRNSIVAMGGNAGLIDSETAPHHVPGCLVNEYVMNGVAYRCD